MRYNFLLLTIFLFFLPSICISQTSKSNSIKETLDNLSVSQIVNLDKEVDLSVNDLPLKEFVRVLANNTGINIVIDNNANWKVNNNFSKVKAKDIIEYLCNEYGLTMNSSGSIIQLKIPPKDLGNIDILYNEASGKINIDSKNIAIRTLFREITEKTGINFTFSPMLNEQSINCFIREVPFEDALKKICFENKLTYRNEGDKVYIIENDIQPKDNLDVSNTKNKKATNAEISNNHGLFSITSNNEPIENILNTIALKSDYKFFFLTPADLKVSINLKDYELLDLLNIVFKGSDLTYKIQDENIYIGSRKDNLLKSCEVYKFNNRRVDSISHQIPVQIINSIKIEEFVELNSLILWGDADQLADFKVFLKQLDKTVPVVLIDVIIMDVSKIYNIETGLEAGLSTEAKSTLGLINPGLDFALSSSSINNVIKSIGLTNLGRVTPNFYVKLKALESDGIIEIRSTPQLSTLNGHSATLSIGKVEYYKEELSNIWGTQNPQLQTQTQYKPVEAKLKIEIRPFVAGNGEISLDVNFSQSEFTERISEYAPPGVVSRDFKSMIRVKNQEMILLGGLEEDSNTVNQSGWPILSRIPVINWFFSKKTKNTTKKHLNIFIKPTIIF